MHNNIAKTPKELGIWFITMYPELIETLLKRQSWQVINGFTKGDRWATVDQCGTAHSAVNSDESCCF
ncbi:hypothetical protein D3C72_2008310 [compost metagenome]